jgi:hypothetical protein
MKYLPTSARPMRWGPTLAFGLLLCSGCGGKGVYPVKGKVVYPDGAAATDLAGFTVNLESAELKVGANGEVRPDGTFTVGTYEVADGALPGTYKACVTPPFSMAPVPPPPIIDPKYGDPDKSGLTVKVEPKPNSITLEVQRFTRSKR